MTIILFFGIIFPESRADGRSEVLKANDEKNDVGSPNFPTFSLNKDFAKAFKSQQSHFSIKSNTRNTKSKPPKDQTTLKEKCRGTLDRSTQFSQSAIITPAIMFLGSLLNTKPLFNHLSLIKYSSWTGNSTKIRPPPFIKSIYRPIFSFAS